MIIPTINIDGTAADDLIEGLIDACDALNTAMVIIGRTYPHGRDYPIHRGWFEQATREHHARVDRLRSVRGELIEIMEAISRQGVSGSRR